MADTPIHSEKFNKGVDLGKAVSDGGVHARIYLGVQGNNVDAAKQALETTINDRLNAEKNSKLLSVNMYDILKEEDADYFSGVAEVEVVSDDFRWFLNLVLRYGPSAVEIIEPKEVNLVSDEMHSITADISDFAHVYSQQIMAMLKDPERRDLYERMLNAK
jgi:hypothetical protein